MHKITTHALDIARGLPAAGLRVVLRQAETGEIIADEILNADGRTSHPLWSGSVDEPTTREIHFHVGDYLARHGETSGFLDIVPIRFRALPGESYHVPLVFSPWAYQTYRGS